MELIITERISDNLIVDRKILDPLKSRFSCLLPDDYVAFLKAYNGGRPKFGVFEFTTKIGEDEDSRVQFFFGWCDNSNYGILQNLVSYEDRIVTGFCPIACDSFGNLLLLSLRKKDHGSIWFWDHELEAEDEPAMDNMTIVAPSFTKFIENLH